MVKILYISIHYPTGTRRERFRKRVSKSSLKKMREEFSEQYNADVYLITKSR